MPADLITWMFLGLGVTLLGLELLLPGMVVVFFGLGALVAGGLRSIGLINSLEMSIVTWMLSSISLVIALRGAVLRFFPAQQSRRSIDDSVAAFGKEVEVLEDCPEVGSEADPGRIRYQGTSWPAVSSDGWIRKGARARLLYQHDIGWVIEPAHTFESPQEEVR